MARSFKTGKNSSLVFTKTMVWFLVIGYAVFLVSTTTWQNYSLNHDTDAQKQKILDLQRQQKTLQLSLLYYQSNAYKETEARRRLNLKGADEHVVALPDAKTEPKLAVVSSEPSVAQAAKVESPPQAWWNLFFGKQQT